MDNYATSFRPSTYAEVVGQDIAKSALKKIAAAEGIAARGIFLKGSWGSGKTTLCKIFAKSMNCETFKKTGDVCNECSGCKEASSPMSQTYLELDASRVGNVEAIRDLKERLYMAPTLGRRVVVLDECHACSPAAQNALLKMLEDGIPNTILVFASTNDVLDTIKSRCICLDISTIPQGLIKKRLKEVSDSLEKELPENIADLIAFKSAGHMRDALSLLQLYHLVGEDGLKSAYHTVEEYMIALARKDKSLAQSKVNELMNFNINEVRTSLYQYIYDTYTVSEDSDKSSSQYKLSKTGFPNAMFTQLFHPVAQAAMNSEVGMKLLLLNLIEKICK